LINTPEILLEVLIDAGDTVLVEIRYPAMISYKASIEGPNRDAVEPMDATSISFDVSNGALENKELLSTPSLITAHSL